VRIIDYKHQFVITRLLVLKKNERVWDEKKALLVVFPSGL